MAGRAGGSLNKVQGTLGYCVKGKCLVSRCGVALRWSNLKELFKKCRLKCPR